MKYKIALVVVLFILPVFGRTPIRGWALAGDQLRALHPIPAQIPVQASRPTDLTGDGVAEKITLRSGSLRIIQDPAILYESPDGWQIVQAIPADVDGDQQLELVMLVWREFKPWPIDQYLASPGRIQNNHNSHNQSCQLILIEWRNGVFREKWAGSPLVRPIKQLALADLDADRRDEVITLQTSYATPAFLPASLLAVWEWNGFGFSIVAKEAGTFSSLTVDQRSGSIFTQ